jgi:excisionase family DNA binding protein
MSEAQDSNSPPRVVYIEEAVKIVGVSISTLRRLIRKGVIAARKIGGRWAFLYDDLIAYITRRTNNVCA